MQHLHTFSPVVSSVEEPLRPIVQYQYQPFEAHHLVDFDISPLRYLLNTFKMKRHKMNKLIYISKGRLVNLHDPLKQKSYFTAHCFNDKFLESITFAGTPFASDIMQFPRQQAFIAVNIVF